MQFKVVSNKQSKRSEYFIKAAEQEGLCCDFMHYTELKSFLPQANNTIIKLEPPVYDTCIFNKGSELTADYISILTETACIKKHESVRFFNDPFAIINSLDKFKSKTAFCSLPHTPLLSNTINNYYDLLKLVKVYQSVFIKPRFGSGAGGVVAMRYNPLTKAIVGFGSIKLKGGILFNTNRLQRYTENDIEAVLNDILNHRAVIERWIPKNSINGKAYDLRVVCSFGKVEYIVVRFSNGAVTNLHLNNMAESFESLNLAPDLVFEIERISLEATRLCGLNYAGVDVLINGINPYIIEVNGQGDHIYNDIFAENRIYRNQIAALV